MKRSEFDWLVRDALGSLHDWAALETHPLAAALPDQAGENRPKSERLRLLLVDTVGRLRPDDGEPDRGARPWRPYLILNGRYVEGLELRALEGMLALSTRQLGREHTRALRAFSSLLQAQLPQSLADSEADADHDETPTNSEDGFEIRRETVSWGDLLGSVSVIAHGQAQAAGLVLNTQIDQPVQPVQVDRVIGRQILLSLLTHAIRDCVGERVSIRVLPMGRQDSLVIRWHHAPSSTSDEKIPASLALADHWTKRLGGDLSVTPGEIILTLPRAETKAVLVVDDQEPAIRLFERYLSQTGMRVVGTQEPESVMNLARELQPQAITLDVMMPGMDGWEVLQSLKSDPDTRHIPVIVCTIWNVGDVAAGFGAAGFLEKPVTQRALLSVLADLGVTDTSA